MSVEATKQQIEHLLKDPDIRVIALTGKWGTGKTHLWRQVKNESKDDSVASSLYVSLFGQRSTKDLKLKLIQCAMPSGNVADAGRIKLGATIAGIQKLLVSLHQGFSVIEDIGLLAAPSVLKGKTIVLDDFERKHDELCTEEVLGFIDEFTQLYGVRFLLVMNSDEIKDRPSWERLREKVVDQEIQLNTTTEEAFAVANKLVTSRFAAEVLGAVSACGLTNIRVVRKVIGATNRIIGERSLSSAVLARLIPSSVLLSTIHYHGIKDGPTTEFVLSAGTTEWYELAKILDEKREAKKDDQGDKLRLQKLASWKSLVESLGILRCDEFELLVVEYLQAGMLDSTSLEALIEKYTGEEARLALENELRDYYESLFWDHRQSTEKLLQRAISILERTTHLDIYNVTSLCDAISKLPGGENAAEKALDTWIENYIHNVAGPIEIDSFFGRRIHPRIQAAITAINESPAVQISALDACIRIARTSGWGPREELALRSATPADYEGILLSATPPELRTFLLQMLKITTGSATYERHFGQASENFVKACVRLVEDRPESRISEIIRGGFDGAGIASLLEN